MRILGLIMTRESEPCLSSALDSMEIYCDAIYVFDDRSRDETRSIALSHKAVKNVFSADRGLPQDPWYFTERQILNTLYGMAEFYEPDWILRLDDDEVIVPAHAVRGILSAASSKVAAIAFPHESVWRDPRYPDMVPLMGETRSMRGAAWRYAPGLKAVKLMHNPRLPQGALVSGDLQECQEIVIYHKGWDTLDKRIARVDRYMSLDPECRSNGGISYDKGLLFGFGRSEIDELIAEYERRYQKHHRSR